MTLAIPRRLSRSIVVPILALLALFAVPTPAAHAAQGTMNYNEWTGICTQRIIDQFGHVWCLSADPRSEVETECGCTGDVRDEWNQNGHLYRLVRYFSPYADNNVIQWNRVTYRQWSPGDPWRAQVKEWRVGSLCCYDVS